MKKTAKKIANVNPKKKSMELNTTHKLGIGALVTLFAILMIISLIIGSSVRRNCIKAQAIYQETCVVALMNLVKDDHRSFAERNTAIWTLGRLRSKEALSVLKSFYTGIIPDREPIDQGISQYEIKKALLLIDKNADTSSKAEMTLKEKLFDCLPKSDMGSKQICDELIKKISTFTECTDAGFPVQETHPERCSTPDGRTFVNSK